MRKALSAHYSSCCICYINFVIFSVTLYSMSQVVRKKLGSVNEKEHCNNSYVNLVQGRELNSLTNPTIFVTYRLEIARILFLINSCVLRD